MNVPEIVSRIEVLIIQNGMSKSDFYSAVGVSSASMSQWRNGKIIPRPQSLERIADYLGVSYEYLVAGGEDKKEKPTVQQDSELDSPVAWATAWDQASPELRRAALAVLKSGAPSASDRG